MFIENVIGLHHVPHRNLFLIAGYREISFLGDKVAVLTMGSLLDVVSYEICFNLLQKDPGP